MVLLAQFYFDIDSVTGVIYNYCPLMRGRAIHGWTTFIGVVVVVGSRALS